MRLKNRVCVITGAAQGLGAATAQRFAEEGARLILTDLDAEKGRATADAIGDRAIFIEQDVCSEKDWALLESRINDEFGGLDVLVNNAGILVAGNIETETPEAYRRTMMVNSESVYLGCQMAIRTMKDRPNKDQTASIINISSIAAMVGAHNLAAYSASKGAVRSLSKSIAAYCARKGYGIRCNSVHPGFADTRMVWDLVEAARDPERTQAALNRAAPLGGLVKPEDVANVALYLASDESRFITGTEMVVDGGAIAQ